MIAILFLTPRVVYHGKCRLALSLRHSQLPIVPVKVLLIPLNFIYFVGLIRILPPTNTKCHMVQELKLGMTERELQIWELTSVRQHNSWGAIVPEVAEFTILVCWSVAGNLVCWLTLPIKGGGEAEN